MNQLLDLLCRNARQSNEDLAKSTGMSSDEVATQIKAWEADGTIRGYQAMVDPALRNADISAFIEVRLKPERGGGFDRLARRISRFDQVTSCYLASGGYDLLVVVEAKDLLAVAGFVSEKLSSIEGVLSCSTRFRLKSYKENGFLFSEDDKSSRLPISP